MHWYFLLAGTCGSELESLRKVTELIISGRGEDSQNRRTLKYVAAMLLKNNYMHELS